MTTEPREFFEDYKKGLRAIKEEAASTIEGFNHFYGKVMSEGALSLKVKELIALAVGVAMHCENCIMIHARGAKKSGASREEILEAASVGVVMGGGPAFTFLPLVQKTLDSLEKE
ncbi:MAG: hypothetical protein PWP57_894 [Candidatus Atribacteria bacterium]|nr:hypothetical protein [Candidatus Atribacteria bacterium]